jgi:hypothetical protein
MRAAEQKPGEIGFRNVRRKPRRVTALQAGLGIEAQDPEIVGIEEGRDLRQCRPMFQGMKQQVGTSAHAVEVAAAPRLSEQRIVVPRHHLLPALPDAAATP